MNRNEMQYPPPIELETNPLQPGDVIETWEGELCKLHDRKGLYDGSYSCEEYPIGAEDNYAECWTRDGYYSSEKEDDTYNVRRVISRANTEQTANTEPTDPDAWKKTPEAIAAWSSLFDALTVGLNVFENNIDALENTAMLCDAKLKLMHERGLL